MVDEVVVPEFIGGGGRRFHSEIPRSCSLAWPPFDADHLLVDAAQMQELEEALFKSGLPQAALMEKAGLAMAERLLARPEWLAAGVLVLVGPGHNGGDGLVVARELNAAGVAVSLWCPIPIRRELTAAHLRHVRWLGLESLPHPPDPNASALWIDALFGLGQKRPLPNELADLFEQREIAQPRRLVSLDVPSGLCCDTGHPLSGRSAKAVLTLCVGLVKRGLRLDPALAYVGQLERIELGLHQRQLLNVPDDQPLRIGPDDLGSLPMPRLPRVAMKYDRGRVLVIAGSDTYRGAAHLSLQGVLASGCGSVQALVPNTLSQNLWQVMPEVVCLPSSSEVCLNRLDAVLFGPGLGNDPICWTHWSDMLQRFSGVLVLDADGLNVLAASPQGWSWLLKRQGPTWLTPHAAEFQRLFPDLSRGDALDVVVAAARRSGCNILLKGAHSVVAGPQGRPLLIEGTVPYVARTGLGDLLAGLAAGWAAMTVASGEGATSSELAAAGLLHARAAAMSASSRAGRISECLEKLVLKCQMNCWEC